MIAPEFDQALRKQNKEKIMSKNKIYRITITDKETGQEIVRDFNEDFFLQDGYYEVKGSTLQDMFNQLNK